MLLPEWGQSLGQDGRDSAKNVSQVNEDHAYEKCQRTEPVFREFSHSTLTTDYSGRWFMKHNLFSGFFLMLFLVLVLPSRVGLAQASDEAAKLRKSRFEISGGAGWAGFADDGWLHHVTATAQARLRIAGGLKFAPEFSYMYRSAADRDLVFVPNLVYEFRRDSKVAPYLIGGVGILRHYEKHPCWSWASNGKTFGFGFGTKIFVSQRFYVAPEVRFGWEPFLRIGGSIGYMIR